MNTSNKRTSNFPYSIAQNVSSSNTLIHLSKINDKESIVCINDEIKYLYNIIEEISYHQTSLEILYHTCDDSGINLANTEEEVDAICTNSTNENNNISKNDDANFFHKYYALFYHKITMNLYLQ